MAYTVILEVEQPVITEVLIQSAQVINHCDENDKQSLAYMDLGYNQIFANAMVEPKDGKHYYALFLEPHNVVLATDISMVVSWMSTHNCECLVEIGQELLDDETMNALETLFTISRIGIEATTFTYGESWDGIDMLLDNIGKIATKITGFHMRASINFGVLNIAKQGR